MFLYKGPPGIGNDDAKASTRARTSAIRAVYSEFVSTAFLKSTTFFSAGPGVYKIQLGTGSRRHRTAYPISPPAPASVTY